MGAVSLRVGDLDRVAGFYRDGVGLDVLSQTGPVMELGRKRAAGESLVLLRLEHAPELRAAEPRSAGLFHTALLFESRPALAAAVYSVAQRYPESFTGSADHLVSEAFYFNDPEGNGVELYFDRERTEWSWAHGQVAMDTLYLDPNGFLQQHLADTLESNRPLEELVHADGTTVGHVHLSVGDVETAREFYVDRLGFDHTLSYGPSAIFVSAGGYHHHMAMNIWNSRGASKRGLALGLGKVEIELPSSEELGAVTERLRHFGIETRDDGQTVRIDDPWNNLIELRSAAKR